MFPSGNGGSAATPIKTRELRIWGLLHGVGPEGGCSWAENGLYWVRRIKMQVGREGWRVEDGGGRMEDEGWRREGGGWRDGVKKVGEEQAEARAGSGVRAGIWGCGSTLGVQRPEPSCKPKSEYQPSDTPFEKETQYQKDFRAWPIPKRGDHPWIPKPGPSPVLALERASPEKPAQEKRRKVLLGSEKKEEDPDGEDEQPKALRAGEGREKGRKKAEEPGGGRAAADALNRQIKEEVAAGVSSSYRNEFRPWVDVKPVKAIKAKAQYKPPEEKMTHETSYSAQFKGETSKPAPADNKFLERRRIRTLYSEPYKEPPKVEKPSVKPSKPKKTTTSHKPLKKAKDKQIASGRAAKKKSAETSNTAKPEDKEKSKEMNNKLAEAKE
uniref:Microtubule-associated protein 6 n=1 Tax=Buteo japonicus TaxID=224669 RepID=A0A8C0BLF5_9AVES